MTLVKLLAFPDYATDENGFLYKLSAGGVARPVRPATHGKASRDMPVYFYFRIGKRKYQIKQSDLKEHQSRALARLIVQSRKEVLP